ncbi:MAG: hypothetical protein K6A92_10305 [Lachnospiraceae bacterium]|nr:hypothetical protein [Lachnospiraceae bacterium]
MNLGRQWNDRLRHFDEAFESNLYQVVGSLKLEGFTTFSRISYETAMKQEMVAFPEGKNWGRKWEYGWFRTRLFLPEGIKEGRLFIHLEAGPEMLVYGNGEPLGAIDKQHAYVIVNAQDIPAEGIELAAEVYAGHGPRLEEGGIVPREVEAVPEPPKFQCCIGKSTILTLDEEMWQAYLDYHVLYDLWQALPEDSLRSMKVGKTLQQFTLEADFEAERPIRRESVLHAAKRLKPYLAEKNSDTVPDYSVIGQSHLDLAWLWTLEETHRKVARTYSNQVALMDRYPEYQFLLCEPILMDWLRSEYPGLYKRVLDKIKTGQMIPEGAVYVEGDMNLPGGESLIRQFVYGKRWFRQELGVESRLAWMPDTFGYSGALPQIMKGCDVSYFSTQKMMRQDPECDPFPYHNFWWEGIDGSRVLSHMYKECNAKMTPHHLLERWEKDRLKTEEMDGFIYPFGYGDGGGGATEEQVEAARRLEDLEGVPRLRRESPVDFMKRLEEKGCKNVYYGEIYLSWHRGTLTSQAKIKRWMRRTEEAVREVEYMTALLRLLGIENGGWIFRTECMWKDLLLNEFHDILPGTGIEQVARDAEESLEDIRLRAFDLIQEEMECLDAQGVILNTLPWPRKIGNVQIPACGFALTQEEAKEASSRRALTDVNEEERSRCLALTAQEKTAVKGKKPLLLWKKEADGSVSVENPFYRILVNTEGEIVSMVDPVTGYEYAEQPLNHFRLYQDINGYYDAWELARMYEDCEQKLEMPIVTGVKEGRDKTLRIHIVLKAKYFTLEQDVICKPDSPRVDFETRIDWKERHRILKVDFPTTIFTRESLAETQYGYLKRPTHRSRSFDRDRYETAHQRYVALSDGEMGLALLNDCKYGYSAKDSRLSLTLLKAAVYPDGHADQGEHRFTYSVMLYRGAIGRSDVLRQAMELNVQPSLSMDILENGKPYRCSEGYGFFRMEGGSAVIDMAKPALDNEKAVVLRIYEAGGSACTADLCLPGMVKRAASCNMLEEEKETLPIRDSKIRLTFRPFEIKTILLER